MKFPDFSLTWMFFFIFQNFLPDCGNPALNTLMQDNPDVQSIDPNSNENPSRDK